MLLAGEWEYVFLLGLFWLFAILFIGVLYFSIYICLSCADAISRWLWKIKNRRDDKNG